MSYDIEKMADLVFNQAIIKEIETDIGPLL
jgi:hypothetical protein